MVVKKRQRVWIDNYDIHSYEIDSTGFVSLTMLIKFMQESAYRHAENLEVGFSQLREKNLFWVLTSQYIKIYSFPKWGDCIQIHTWPAGKSRLAYLRDFRIFDSNRRIIGVGTTKWYAIDMARKRPQNIDGQFEARPMVEERSVEIELNKLAGAQADSPNLKMPVGFSDIDINGHVNNVRYIDWLMECFSLDFHHSHQLSEIQINYLSEAIYRDEIAVYLERVGNLSYRCSIKRVPDDKELCRAQTEWKPAITK